MKHAAHYAIAKENDVMTWEYTKELEDKIVEMILNGASFRKIGRTDGFPSRDTLMRWEREIKDFATNVARAREAKLEDDAEQLEEINEMVMEGKLDPQQASVISNNIKWVASRLLPKKYGDKMQNEHSGKVAIVNIIDDIPE